MKSETRVILMDDQALMLAVIGALVRAHGVQQLWEQNEAA